VGNILEHKHLIIRAEITDPPYDAVDIKRWMKNLVEDIGMNILMGPYAVYSDMEGNQGLTAVTIIETSHLAIHVWDECEPALMQMDVYTCSHLELDTIWKAIEEFKPTKVEYKFIDREHSLTLLDSNTF